MARTFDDLRQLQALPLSLKVDMTKTRIRQWVREFGEDGVYISFSGGKDSTVLLHLVRSMYPNIPAVFVNTGLEYPEIVQFVKTFPNVEIIKPKMNFKKVIEQYGYPFISKETAECVYNVRKYEESNGTKYKEFFRKINGLNEFGKDGKRSRYSMQRYSFFMLNGAPKISHMCCTVMKKSPIHEYSKTTGKMAITAEMASESRRRTTNWVRHGCNMFSAQHPKSTPMAFWTEQDVLQYIQTNGIKIASVYGDIVTNEKTCILKTTGCSRTGCMFCGFGCQREKPNEGRFERIKKTHPKLYEWIMKPWESGGLNYKAVIDWINENGGLHIKY